MTFDLNLPILKIISDCAKELNVPVFIVGGWVRDQLLKRPCKDLDFVSLGKGIKLAEKVASKLGDSTKVHVFKNFGTAQIVYRDFNLEFVGARRESYRKDSRKPIVEDGTLADDQNRRDFTINALAISLNPENFGELIDPFNGLNDLKNKIIRTPLNPDTTYSDDPLRMMRAIRFATQLNFTIEEESLNAISRNKERILIVSKERITEELNKIILSPKPSLGFKLLFDTGLLSLIFPALAKLQGVETKDGLTHKDNFYHTLEVLDNLANQSDNLWLRWAAILHDIAKPQTKRFEKGTGWTFHGHDDKGARMVPQIFAELKLPLNDKMKYVQKLVALHLRPIVLAKTEVTDSAIRRLLVDAGDDLEDLMLLCKCDITTKNPNRLKRYLQNFEIVREKLQVLEEKDRLRNWQPPITGEIIMKAFNLKPCKEVGIIKTAVKEAILEGIIPNKFEEAYNFMLEEGKKLGLDPQ